MALDTRLYDPEYHPDPFEAYQGFVKHAKELKNDREQRGVNKNFVPAESLATKEDHDSIKDMLLT